MKAKELTDVLQQNPKVDVVINFVDRTNRMVAIPIDRVHIGVYAKSTQMIYDNVDEAHKDSYHYTDDDLVKSIILEAEEVR